MFGILKLLYMLLRAIGALIMLAVKTVGLIFEHPALVLGIVVLIGVSTVVRNR